MVNLDAIAKRVAHKESLPRCGPAIVNLDACGLQPASQSIYVGALDAKVPLRVRGRALLLHREVNIKSSRVKPDAAPTTKRLRLGDLSKAKMSAVELTGNVFTALRHGYIDVCKMHGV